MTTTAPIYVKSDSGMGRQKRAPFHSDRSKMWCISDNNSGKDKEEAVEVAREEEGGKDQDNDDQDADSTASADSGGSISTPESSPPSNRHAILHGEDHVSTSAFGAFDANGKWTWSKIRPQDSDVSDNGIPSKICANGNGQRVLNRHDRSHMAMIGSIGKLSAQPTPCSLFWTQPRDVSHDDLQDSDDDSYDVVGFTSYHPRETSGEADSIVVPVRICVEDDSSSDESESSVTTNSSSGSDPEARRRARVHMLQRLGRNIPIPQRRASTIKLGHGAPRRPPSLDEISNRVVSGCTNYYAKGTPPTSAVPHQQRSVSCPAPLPLQREWFGEVQVMVTPPTPQMPAEKIPGVVLKSPHMPSCAFFTDARGNLVAPAFDVAPGRQIMLEERERQAEAWLKAYREQQQRQYQQQQERQALHLTLGAAALAPPMATGDQAAATFAPISPPRRKPASSNCGPGPVAATSLLPFGGPPIPPRRRSLGGQRQASAQLHAQVTSKVVDPDQACTRRPSPVEVRGCIQTPVDLPSTTTATPVTPNRRSLVARLSLRKSSKEIQAACDSLRIPRKAVPTAAYD